MQIYEINTRPSVNAGENNPRAKLTAHDVELIRELAAGGMLHRDIADKFEIKSDTVGRIVRFERWNTFEV